MTNIRIFIGKCDLNK